MRYWMGLLPAMTVFATSCADAPPPKGPVPRPAETQRTALVPTPILRPILTPVAVCDSVSARWRADTAYRVTRDVIDTSQWSPVPRGTPFCEVKAFAAAGPTPGIRPDPSYWSDSTKYGWLRLLHKDADGPDGYSRTLQHGEVRCSVEYAFDGEDDADSTYVRKSWIREETLCWRAVLTPSDSSQ